jgi:tetratricopeptide (TPR) repeat protein
MEPCFVCLDNSPPPIKLGCACRAAGSVAHLDCLANVAASQLMLRGKAAWRECQTCKQDFQGAMRIGLAEAWCARTRHQAEESEERMFAQGNLAIAYTTLGKFDKAEPIQRALHAVQSRVWGVEFPSTLTTACNLAMTLGKLGRFADAERIEREAHSAYARLLGPEHTSTLICGSNLAGSLCQQGKYADAEKLLRQVYEIAKRTLGRTDMTTLTTQSLLGTCLFEQNLHCESEALRRLTYSAYLRILGREHPSTLLAAVSLATSLSVQCVCTGKVAEAEQMEREALALQTKILGAEHPETMTSMNNHADTLFKLGRRAEAEKILRDLVDVETRVQGAAHPETLCVMHQLARVIKEQGRLDESLEIFQTVLATRARVLGAKHPRTQESASMVEEVRAKLKTQQPTKKGNKHTGRRNEIDSAAAMQEHVCVHTCAAYAGAPAVYGGEQRLPSGTRVLVQQLVAKPEYNGKLARVLSFDELSGRYGVALDDGRELSLKPGCIARAGCAAAGCASEEASNVCAQCHAVRYCSRECQRADWKMHKSSCKT